MCCGSFPKMSFLNQRNDSAEGMQIPVDTQKKIQPSDKLTTLPDELTTLPEK